MFFLLMRCLFLFICPLSGMAEVTGEEEAMEAEALTERDRPAIFFII